MMRYTAEQHAFLVENFPAMTNKELADAFNARFGVPITGKQLNSYGRNHSLRKDAGVRERAVSIGQGSIWTPEVDEWFIAFVPGHTESEISAECERLFGFPLTEGQIGNRKVKYGVKSGTVGGRFRKGMEPANKGKTGDEMGISPESQAASRATCFKKGNEPDNAKAIPVGTERTNMYGIVEVKVRRMSPIAGTNKCWRPKHHLVWEEANGRPVPPGTMVVFADHDKRNFAPENLVAVPRRLWATISKSGMDYYDRESLEVAMLAAQLRQKAHDKQCSERECRKCSRTFKPRYPHQRTCDKCLGRER